MSSSKEISPAMYENSHVLEVLLTSTEEKEEDLFTSDDEHKVRKIYKKWTKENEKTIRKWQLDIEKSSFVYCEILNRSKNRMTFVLTFSLIFNTLNALFSALSVTLGFLNEKWIGLVFTIMILITATSVAICSGLMKIYGWDSDVVTLSPYVEKLHSTWLNCEIELNLPPKERTDALDFLRRYDGQYMSLMHESPPISHADYMDASHKYQKKLFDNYIWSQKFRKNMITQMEEIV